MFGDGRRERFGIRRYLLLIALEARLHRFLKADGFGGDGVNERAALRAGEGELVEFLRKRGFTENHAAARAPQRLVGSGRDDVGVRYRTRMYAGGNESGDVRHVHEEERVYGFRDFADALEIDDARIGARSRHDHFGLVFVSELFDLVVVDALVFFANSIGNEVVHAAGEIQRVTVS